MKIETETNNPMSPTAITRHPLKCCGAKTRAGGRCGQVPMANGRCHFHGGKSTGPRTAKGLERMRQAKTKHGWRGDEGRRLREMIRGLRETSKTLIEVC